MKAPGPAVLITTPDPTNRPAPMTPPMAIMVRCRCFSPLCSWAPAVCAVGGVPPETFVMLRFLRAVSFGRPPLPRIRLNRAWSHPLWSGFSLQKKSRGLRLPSPRPGHLCFVTIGLACFGHSNSSAKIGSRAASPWSGWSQSTLIPNPAAWKRISTPAVGSPKRAPTKAAGKP